LAAIRRAGALANRARLHGCAEASDGSGPPSALRDDIDLAVLDAAMPLRTGPQAARDLNRRRPELRIVMLSMRDLEAIRHGLVEP
jgi:DNA-binding NarL/FixJ family response regulator